MKILATVGVPSQRPSHHGEYLTLESNASCTPPGNLDVDDFIDQHRSLIASSTNDSRDQDLDQPSNVVDNKDGEEEEEESSSSTVDVDNTHAYLVRSAEKYSHEVYSKEMSNVGTTRFLKVHKRVNRKSISEEEGGIGLDAMADEGKTEGGNNFDGAELEPSKEESSSLHFHPPGNKEFSRYPTDEVLMRADENEELSLPGEEIEKETITESNLIMESPREEGANAEPKASVAAGGDQNQTTKQKTSTIPEVALEPLGQEECELITEGTQTEENLLATDAVTGTETKPGIIAAKELESKLDSNAVKELEIQSDHPPNADETCVNFDTSPTVLFKLLYSEKWPGAQARLKSHPEEAKVWVVRYSKITENTNPDKSSNENSKGSNLRWKLLPLHLFIALAGSNSMQSQSQSKVPEDERDEIITADRDFSSPPISLLIDLISAHPDATASPDDQGMIPLHSAIRGNSSIIIVSKLLEADPSSIYWKDSKERDAFAIAKKAYERKDKKQVEMKSRERKQRYSELKKLLSGAASRIAQSSAEVTEQNQELFKKKQIQKLQNEVLILRRDNALLRHRAMSTDRTMKDMQKKILLLQQQLSSEIDKYNTLFGSEDESDVRREQILLSISQESDKEDVVEKVAPNAEKGKEVEKAKESPANKSRSGGYYTKRLQRYNSSRNSSMADDVISPVSTMTAATEVTTPPSSPPRTAAPPVATQQKNFQGIDWESRCRALELESSDEDDPNDREDKSKACLQHGDAHDGSVACEGNMGNGEGGGSKDISSSKLTESRSPSSRDIFRKQEINVLPHSKKEDINAVRHSDGATGMHTNGAKQIDEAGKVNTIAVAETRLEGVECEHEYQDADVETNSLTGGDDDTNSLLHGIFGSFSVDDDDNTTNQYSSIEKPMSKQEDSPLDAAEKSRAPHDDVVKYSTAKSGPTDECSNEQDEPEEKIKNVSVDDDDNLSEKCESEDSSSAKLAMANKTSTEPGRPNNQIENESLGAEVVPSTPSPGQQHDAKCRQKAKKITESETTTKIMSTSNAKVDEDAGAEGRADNDVKNEIMQVMEKPLFPSEPHGDKLDQTEECLQSMLQADTNHEAGEVTTVNDTLAKKGDSDNPQVDNEAAKPPLPARGFQSNVASEIEQLRAKFHLKD